MKKELNDKGINKYLIFLKGFIIETVVAALFIAIFAFVMYYLEAGYTYAPVFATASIAAGCLAAAFYAAKKIGNKGFLTGLTVGGITFLIVTIVALIVDSGAVTVNTLFHFIIIMLSSLIGGVLGVNKGQNKKYI